MHPDRQTLKAKAIAMRKRGASIRDVEKRLGIAKSTLHYWFRNLHISEHYRVLLKKRADKALVSARRKAVEWHRAKKIARHAQAKDEAAVTMQYLDASNKAVTELALAMLYFGEGSKSDKGLVIGNTDAKFLKFFVSALQYVYNIDIHKLRCELHLRADQDRDQEVRYWSTNLKIPSQKFIRVYFDPRTRGKKTFEHYHGVCVVSYDRVAIQRKLMYLYAAYCDRTVNLLRG